MKSVQSRNLINCSGHDCFQLWHWTSPSSGEWNHWKSIKCNILSPENCWKIPFEPNLSSYDFVFGFDQVFQCQE